MTAAQHALAAAGKALYGEQWQAPLSRGLGVSDRTMRRWAAGDTVPPDAIWLDVVALLRARHPTIIAAINAALALAREAA